MTRRTLLCRGNMIHRLASGRGAVMATGATGGDAGMVKGGRNPRHRFMTQGAILHRHHMCRRFTGGAGAVMTTGAARGDARMTEGGNQPAISGVTKAARLSGLNVAAAFAYCYRAVMARVAVTEYLCVTYGNCWPPADLVMTGATIIC